MTEPLLPIGTRVAPRRDEEDRGTVVRASLWPNSVVVRWDYPDGETHIEIDRLIVLQKEEAK